MIGTLYKALSGMQGFSKGLDVMSNNISNMNSPGYKGQSLNFRDLFYRYSDSGAQVGQGMQTGSSRINFAQGDFQATGNPLDVAIDGNGFLVLKDGEDEFFTRAGQLQVDSDGFLVDQSTGHRVQQLLGSGQLQDISINNLEISPPRATATVTLNGNLDRNLGTSGTVTRLINNVTVYDSDGVLHTLQIQLISSVPAVWTVNVYEPSVSATAVIGTGQIQYQGNGTPSVGFHTVTVTLTPPATSGASPSTIDFEFGEPGSTAGTTGYSGAGTNPQVASQDGFPPGALTKMTLSENGTLELTYSNGETANGPRLALAWFQQLQALTPSGQSLFVNDSGQQAIYAHPDESIMGKMVAGKIELANVVLTQQFTEMIIIQRGYQACSQITSVANEMMQQLLNIQGQR